MLTPILMAGGSGTRLWPLSRKNSPKQVHALLDEETLLKKTVDRYSRGFGAENLWIATTAQYLSLVRKDVPKISKKHISVEPVRRENAAALGLALVKILKEDSDAVFVYANTDNYVRDEKEFLRVLHVAESLVRAEPEYITLIGVRPTYPETGYGYIKTGDVIARMKRKGGKGEDEVFSVAAFVEKPNHETAVSYLENVEYLWNPTLIVAKVSTFLARYEKHVPELYRGLMKIKDALGTKKEDETIKKIFPKLPAVAMEYAILEKEKTMRVIPASFGWTDVGSWRLVHEILAKKPGDSVVKTDHVHVDSSNNLLVSTSKKMIATIGVHDMVIVETADAILVCPKDRSQEVKKLVEELERRKFGELT